MLEGVRATMDEALAQEAPSPITPRLVVTRASTNVITCCARLCHPESKLDAIIRIKTEITAFVDVVRFIRSMRNDTTRVVNITLTTRCL